MMYYVYVIRSKETNRLYIGSTGDLRRRIQEHKNGKTWTTKRMSDFELVFYESFRAKSDALRREKYFKTSKGKSSLKQIIRDSIDL